MSFIANQDTQEIAKFGYEVVKELGRGSFGVVYLGVKKGQEFAIKTVKKQQIEKNEKLIELFQSEKQLLTTINSNHIIKLLNSFESEKNYFLAMEYCNGGTLEKYIQQKKYISEKEAKRYLIQLLSGFKDLHSHLVIHRDIKLENIMRHFPNGETGNPVEDNKNVILKIADLGLAKEMKDELITRTFAGTVSTMAPEILKHRSYGFEVDVYSLGVILYQMVQGRFPFQGNNDRKLLKKIKEQNVQFSNDNPVSEDFQDLIKQMLKYKKRQRIQWCAIINHKSIQPENQLTVSQRLDHSQNEEINQSKVGFEKISDLYEVQNKFPQYQCKKKLLPITQNNFVNIFIALDAENPKNIVIVKQVISDYYMLREFEQTTEQIKTAFKIISSINEKNILKIHLFSTSKNKFYIISEYLKYGNLFEFKFQNKKFNQYEIQSLLVSVLNSLKWLHENRIVHRNINLKSIYISEYNESINVITKYKLGGFKYCQQFESRSQYAQTKYKGMSFYIAPEILNDRIYSQTSDIYSLGIVLYELIYGSVPYTGSTKKELLDNILNQRKIQMEQAQGISEQLLELIDKMINPDEKQRISFYQLWKSEIIKDYFNKNPDLPINMQAFYQQNQKRFDFQLSQFVNQSDFEQLLKNKFELSSQKINLPQAPQINYLKPFKFKYYSQGYLFADKDSNVSDDIKCSENSNQYIKTTNNQQKNIQEYLKNQEKKSQINPFNEDQKFSKFVESLKILIDQAKKSQNFELCIYYSKVLEDQALKKQEFDQTKDASTKLSILKQLHKNYEKINIQS